IFKIAAGVHDAEFYVCIRLKIFTVILFCFSARKFHLVYPSFVMRKQGKAGSKRNCTFRLQKFHEPAKVIGKVLLAQYPDFSVIFIFIMDCIWKIPCTAPSREKIINHRPSLFYFM